MNQPAIHVVQRTNVGWGWGVGVVGVGGGGGRGWQRGVGGQRTVPWCGYTTQGRGMLIRAREPTVQHHELGPDDSQQS